MDVHRVLGVAGVAAGHRDDDRDGGGAALVEDERIAPREALLAESEAAEAVVVEGVRAGEVDDEVGAEVAQDGGKVQLQRGEVDVVARAVREVDVEGAALAAEGV